MSQRGVEGMATNTTTLPQWIGAEWKRHFDVLGFCVIRNAFSNKEMRGLRRETDRLLREDRNGTPFLGKTRQQVYGFIESSEVLCDLPIAMAQPKFRDPAW